MIKFKVIAFFLVSFSCAWGRPQPSTVVWPRKEESLDSDIDALLQEYPHRNQAQQPVPPSYSNTESPVDVATPPSISHLPPTPLHYTPSPEHFKTREPRFWSRIESTTVGPHDGGFDEVYNPANYEHDEKPSMEIMARAFNPNYPNLPNTQDQRNPPVAPPVEGQTNWRSQEGSGMPTNPNERNPNPPSGGPWSWGNREGVHPPSPASPFYPEYPINMAAPIDQAHFQEDLASNQERMLRAYDLADAQAEQQQAEVSTQFQTDVQSQSVDPFLPVNMGIDTPQDTSAFRQPTELTQQQIEAMTQQQESLSERAAANPQSVRAENYNHHVRNLQPYQNLPSPHQREALALQNPGTTMPWYMPRRANCRPIEKVVKVQQCEPYTVETCWKEARQECNPQPVTNCTGVVETKFEQVCFNVVDELCSLMETVQTEKTEDSYQVQDCFFAHEKEVCGISHEVEKFDKDDYDCATVKVLACHQIPQYVHDVNCIDSVEFDCKEVGYQPGTYLPEIVCTQNPIKNCYKIPRKVYREVCETIEQRHCEAFNNVRAVPVEKQVCKHYTKKSCDFKIETSPKINKHFNYEIVCRPKRREICEHIETKTVSPDCETSERLSCKYVPWKHRCKYDPKHYCHMVDKVVEEEVCDTVYGYGF